TLQVVDHGQQVTDQGLGTEADGVTALARDTLLQVLAVGTLAQPALVRLARLLPGSRELGFELFDALVGASRLALRRGIRGRMGRTRPFVVTLVHHDGCRRPTQRRGSAAGS